MKQTKHNNNNQATLYSDLIWMADTQLNRQFQHCVLHHSHINTSKLKRVQRICWMFLAKNQIKFPMGKWEADKWYVCLFVPCIYNSSKYYVSGECDEKCCRLINMYRQSKWIRFDKLSRASCVFVVLCGFSYIEIH